MSTGSSKAACKRLQRTPSTSRSDWDQYCPPASKRPLVPPCSANCSIQDDSDCACKRRQAFSAVLLSPTLIRGTLNKTCRTDSIQARATAKANRRAPTLEENCVQGYGLSCRRTAIEPTLLRSLVSNEGNNSMRQSPNL